MHTNAHATNRQLHSSGKAKTETHGPVRALPLLLCPRRAGRDLPTQQIDRLRPAPTSQQWSGVLRHSPAGNRIIVHCVGGQDIYSERLCKSVQCDCLPGWRLFYALSEILERARLLQQVGKAETHSNTYQLDRETPSPGQADSAIAVCQFVQLVHESFLR